MKQKILIVDDEPDALEVIAFKLKEAGYIPLTAADGQRAVTLVRDERPALVVLDLMLPLLDGLEVCKILRRDPATAAIPIIMVTARAARDGPHRRPGTRRGRLCDQTLQPRELVLRRQEVLARSQQADEPGAHCRSGNWSSMPAATR